jgi:hypothetical protein
MSQMVVFPSLRVTVGLLVRDRITEQRRRRDRSERNVVFLRRVSLRRLSPWSGYRSRAGWRLRRGEDGFVGVTKQPTERLDPGRRVSGRSGMVPGDERAGGR